MIAAGVLALVLVGVIWPSAMLGGLGLSDGGDVHSGVAVAQSEEEEDSRTTGVTVSDNESESNETTETNGSDDAREVSQTGNSTEPNESTEGNESNESTASGEPSPTEERAASETGGTVDGVNDANETRTATEERADSEVPAGPNESGSERAGVDDTEEEDDEIGFVAQRFLDMVEGVTTQIQNEFGELVSQMLEYAVSRSAPGVSNDPSTWSNPEETKWQGAISVMQLTRLMGGFFAGGMVLYSIATYKFAPRKAKQRLIRAIPVGIFLAKPALFIGGTLHGSTVYSTAISPSPDAFATPEGMLAVGVGVITAGLFAASSMWVIALAMVVTVVSHEAGLATTAFLPLAASFFLGPMYLKSIGEMVVYLHGVTVVMPFFQALGTLAVVRMFFSGGGALTSLSGVLAFLGTIYLLYYLFQREVLEKAFNAPIVSLGVDGAQMAADGAKNVKEAPAKMREIRASIEANLDSARSVFTGSDGSSGSSGSGWRPDIGQVQPSLSAGRSNRAAMADGGSDGAYPHATSTSSGADAESWGTRPVGRDEQGRFQSIDQLQENRERSRLANGDY